MKPPTFEQCMDILDWFDDPLYEYIGHILLSKLDGEDRVHRALGCLIEHANRLLVTHKDTESAYPTELWNQPARLTWQRRTS